jgi:hypothetical protein
MTAACENGLKAYRSEAAAKAACGDDEVVYFQSKHSFYVTNAHPMYGKPHDHNDMEFGCLQDVIRVGYTCSTFHDPSTGPLPIETAPACYNVPGKPKV